MYGHAVPVRFSRRIKRTRLLPARMSPKRKIRKSAVKKKALCVNSSLLKAKDKIKVAKKKNSLKERSNHGSIILKQAPYIKPVTRNSLRLSIPNICDNTRKTRNSLKASQVNFTNDKMSLKNIEFDKSEKVSGKENCKKFVNDEKKSVRRSLRLSKSSSKEKDRNKELSGIDLNSQKNTKPIEQKSTKVITLSHESVLTPNPKKCMRTSKVSERKKSTRLSIESRNQEISVHITASESFAVTPGPGKVTRISKHLGNQKPGKLSKERNSSKKLNSQISLHASSSHSFLDSPQFEKKKETTEKRKSTRSLVQSPLRALNKELSFSTPACLLVRNPNSSINKSSKSCKSLELSLSESRFRKQNRPKKIGSTASHENQKRQINQHKKTSGNFKMPSLNGSENIPLDVLTTPALKPPYGRCLPKKYLSKSDSKSSKRKLNASASENHLATEELLDAKKRRSTGDNVSVDNSTCHLKMRSMKKNISGVTISRDNKLISTQYIEGCLMPVMNVQGKVDVLTDYSYQKFSRKKLNSMPCKDNKHSLCIGGRKAKSTGNFKRKRLKRLISNRTSPNKNTESSSSTSKKASPVKSYHTKTHNIYESLQVNSIPVKVDCLTVDLHKIKRRRAKSAPLKNKDGSHCESGKSTFSETKWIKTLAPIKFTKNVNLSTESSQPNSIPIDNLTTNESASSSQNVGRLVVKVLSPCCISKNENHSWPFGSEISTQDDVPEMPTKGTLKHKRWLLNNLKEKNGSYEDDIFENRNLDLYKSAFHFGDESDGSSVNIATPKFDCILTPALPRKTPRFKDCISPTEFLQARKTAEEYLYRRNKKRKSGDRRSSGKKTSMNKKNSAKDIPEKKKLDFEEAVNKLIEVQKNLEIEAEVNNEEEDSYFSDASN